MTIEDLKDMLLTDRVRQLLQRGRNRIVLNLEGVPYIDTSGVCNIVEAYITTKRQDGSLKLLRLTAHVREMLVITRLLTIFEAYDSEAAAIASFGPTAPA